MPIIELQNVYKNYEIKGITIPALQGIDLTLEKGEFTALAGPSGSGKTTLLNIIGGLDRPTSGSVKVADISLNDLSLAKLSDFRLKKIGFVFQAYNLIPVLNAIENVEYVLLLQGVD